MIAAWASEVATLLPSPMNATVRPRRLPQRSSMVSVSASAWHGCSSFVSALTTLSRGRGIGKFLDPRLCVGANDSGRNPAFQVPRDIADRLTTAEGDVLGRLDHVAAELTHGNLERGPRAEGGLLEQQRDMQALERPLVTAPGRTCRLHPAGKLETGHQ